MGDGNRCTILNQKQLKERVTHAIPPGVAAPVVRSHRTRPLPDPFPLGPLTVQESAGMLAERRKTWTIVPVVNTWITAPVPASTCAAASRTSTPAILLISCQNSADVEAKSWR